MNKRFKKIMQQIHLWLGLGTGLIVFIISITGCLYVFEKEIRELTQKDYLYVPAQHKTFAGLGKILKSFEKIAPGKNITSIRITNGRPNATVCIIAGKDNVYYLNPYNGSLVKKTKPDWLVTVQSIHISLLLGETGKLINKTAVVIFVMMLITGWILWFPKQMRLLKQALTIKWGASFKRLNYDLHSVLGFYASMILIVIASCGLYFAFPEVKTAVSFFTGTKLIAGKKALSAKPLGIDDVALRYDKIYTTVANEFPGAALTSFSIRKDGELRLRLTYPYRWARHQHTFYYDPATGRLLRYKLYKDFNAADFIEATNYDLHTGQLFGLFSKIVACIVSLISASLPVTGFIIWWKKKKKVMR